MPALPRSAEAGALPFDLLLITAVVPVRRWREIRACALAHPSDSCSQLFDDFVEPPEVVHPTSILCLP